MCVCVSVSVSASVCERARARERKSDRESVREKRELASHTDSIYQIVTSTLHRENEKIEGSKFVGVFVSQEARSVSEVGAARGGMEYEGNERGNVRTGRDGCHGGAGERKLGRASSLFVRHGASAASRPLSAGSQARRRGAPARAEQCTSQRADAAACGRFPDVGGEPRVPGGRGLEAHRHVQSSDLVGGQLCAGPDAGERV